MELGRLATARKIQHRLLASAAYPHSGFWQPMDTLREKNQLEEMWASGRAPWKQWP